MLVTGLVAFGAGWASKVTGRIDFKKVTPGLHAGMLDGDGAVDERD